MEWKKTQFDWSLLPKGSLNSQWSRFIHAFVCFYISFSMCLHFSPIYRLNWVTSNMIELIKWQCLCFSRVAKVFFISSKYWSVAFVLDADVIVWWRWVLLYIFYFSFYLIPKSLSIMNRIGLLAVILLCGVRWVCY